MFIDISVTILVLVLLGYILLRCASQWGAPLRIPCLAAGPWPDQPKEKYRKDWQTFLFALAVRLTVIAALVLCAVLASNDPLSPEDLQGKFQLWDARHYANLIEQGYTAYQEDGKHIFLVFFPAYVWVVRLVRLVIPNTIAAGVAVSSLCFAWGCCYVHKLARQLYDEAAARDAVLFLSCFPFSFFYGAVMTEGLFLLATAAALYYALRRKWLLYGIFGALAALTRMTGVLVIAFAGLELLADLRPLERPVGKSIKKALLPFLKKLPLVLMPLLGTLGYMLLNFHVDGNPMAFSGHQEHWHQGGMWVSHVVRYIVDYWGMNGRQSAGWAIWAPALILFIGGFVVLALAGIREDSRPALVMFTALYFVANFSLAWLLSAGRYLSCGFGLFIFLAVLVRKREWVRSYLLVAGCLLMGVYLSAYVNGAHIM